MLYVNCLRVGLWAATLVDGDAVSVYVFDVDGTGRINALVGCAGFDDQEDAARKAVELRYAAHVVEAEVWASGIRASGSPTVSTGVDPGPAEGDIDIAVDRS